MWQPIKKISTVIAGCRMSGELLNSELTTAIPKAARNVRHVRKQDAKKVISARLRSGVQIEGTPRFGNRVVSIAVRIRAARVKYSGKKREIVLF